MFCVVTGKKLDYRGSEIHTGDWIHFTNHWEPYLKISLLTCWKLYAILIACFYSPSRQKMLQFVWVWCYVINTVHKHAGLYAVNSIGTILPPSDDNIIYICINKGYLQASNYAFKAISTLYKCYTKLSTILSGCSVFIIKLKNKFTNQNKNSLPNICVLALECVWGRCAANSDLPLTLRVDSGGFPRVMTGDCGCCWHNHLI